MSYRVFSVRVLRLLFLKALGFTGLVPCLLISLRVTRLRIFVLLCLEYTVNSIRRIIAVDFLLFVLPISRALSLVRALYRSFVVIKLVDLSISNRSR